MRRAAWMVAAVTGLVAVSGLAAAQQAPEPTEAEILAQFKFEPSVQEVQDAAIRYYQVHPDRIKSLRANAQLKALVPTITGGFNNQINSNNRNMMDGLYVKANPPLPYKEYEVNTGDSMGFTISATWMLDRLVFNAEVLDVQSLIGILDGVVREVTTVYYIRRRMQIDGILRPIL